ncbi:MAG TPA: winged helix-turn-helix transcriptional regulator, partial [Thermoprotei archaeon]|nr:winged helix-turn-helix transcriptional regulator [Thermoprotei archaeon]
KVGGDGVPYSSKEFHGPVWRVADEVMEYLIGELMDLEVVIGPRRERIGRYPLRAVRESLVNAITHRNYAISSDILVSLYPDRLVISSPGSLVPGVDLDEPIHIPRNPVLSQLMYDTGYIERYGSGIVLMKKLCREHPLVDLEFISRGYSFKVVFKLSINKLGLDDIDERIINILVRNPSSSKELAGEIGLSKQAVVKRLNKLIELGLVRKRGKGWRTQYYIG